MTYNMYSSISARSPFIVTTISHEDHINNNKQQQQQRDECDNGGFHYNSHNYKTCPPQKNVVTPSAPPPPSKHDSYRDSRILVCYTPANSETTVTCSSVRDSPKIIFTTDPTAAVIPMNAIIDSIEFFGLDNFTYKGSFSIGLGQLNSDISFPLIIDSDAEIANERIGGCRDFISQTPNGSTNKNIVLCDSFVNVELPNPITFGCLQIVIRYHMKIVD